jgi:methionine biosynthesis protein MetW
MEYMTVGYDLVINEVPENAKVLDLGCGDGSLLVKLQEKKKIKGYGVEISERGVSLCLEKGLYCYQADIDDGLSDYKDDSFDYVILNQTIQNTKRPDYVITEVLRIGKKSIISFPNFAHISTRLYLMFKGSMPVNKLIPYEWYESPDIHHLTISDMKKMSEKFSFNIINEKNFSSSKDGESKIINFFPNLFAQYGFFVIEKN